MKKFFIENKNLFILWILCGVALFIFCGHYGNILLDIGREVYYPERILDGKVLYKDLFNIYGPFAYLWNALLYKIFSPNLATLYFSGVLCSLAIVSGIYLIAKRYLTEFLSLSLGIFTIITGVCATHLFSFTLPYSWAMLYGTVGFIYSVLALIKFKSEDKLQYLYLSSLLAGFCVCNKYDFFVYSLFLFIVVLFTKNKRAILSCLTCFLLFPVICSLTLFFQGLRVEHVLSAIEEIKDMIATNALNNFYTVQGIYFNSKLIWFWVINLLKTGVGFGGLIAGYKLLGKNKIAGWVVITLFALLIVIFATPIVFIFMVPLLLVMTIFSCKNIKNNVSLILLVLCALSVCAKCFWSLHPMNYGNYFIAIILTAFFAVVFSFADKRYEKMVAIGLLCVGLNFLYYSTINRIYLTGKISTEKGTIYTYESGAEATNSLISILEQSKSDTVLIFPEGLIVNFLSGVKSDDYYNSFLPLYAESMGENTFVNHINSSKPKYIIFNSISVKEYGYTHVCDDYGSNFCQFVMDNYAQTEAIDGGIRYVIFGLNK